MREGKIMQFASPAEIYGKPVNKYVADFIGSPAMNFLEGCIENGAFHFDSKVFFLNRYDFAEDKAADCAAWIGIRPEDVRVTEAPAEEGLSVCVRADIVEQMGTDALLWNELGKQSSRMHLHLQFDIKEDDNIDMGFQVMRFHCLTNSVKYVCDVAVNIDQHIRLSFTL